MKKIVTFAFLIALLLAGCTQRYIPMVVNAPLLSQPGEVQGSMHIANNGYSLQLAASPIAHLAVMGQGNVFTVVMDSNHDYDRKLLAGELGLGWYTRLSRTGRLEIFGGMGEMNSGTFMSRWYMRRYFLQASGGVSAPVYDLVFTARFSWADHYLTRTAGIATEEQGDELGFFEPAVTLRAGYENFKFSLQGGLCLPMGKRDVPLASTYKGSLLAFGIHFNFGKDYDRYE